MEATIKTLATKDDIANLRKDMGNDIANLRKDMGNDMANIRKEISEAKVDTIKWMFIFWIGQVAAMLAIVFLFLKK